MVQKLQQSQFGGIQRPGAMMADLAERRLASDLLPFGRAGSLDGAVRVGLTRLKVGEVGEVFQAVQTGKK